MNLSVLCNVWYSLHDHWPDVTKLYQTFLSALSSSIIIVCRSFSFIVSSAISLWLYLNGPSPKTSSDNSALLIFELSVGSFSKISAVHCTAMHKTFDFINVCCITRLPASVCVAEFGTFWEEPCNIDLDYEEILKRNLKAKVNALMTFC